MPAKPFFRSARKRRTVFKIKKQNRFRFDLVDILAARTACAGELEREVPGRKVQRFSYFERIHTSIDDKTERKNWEEENVSADWIPAGSLVQYTSMNQEQLHACYRNGRQSYPHAEGGSLLVIVISEQTLYLYKKDRAPRAFPVSTSRYGTGSGEGSNQTPLGYHRIKEKIGGGAPKRAVFRGRRRTGEPAEISTDQAAGGDDCVTTRILRLEGLEPGKNRGKGVSSFYRYIYIHGTPEEGLIGTPASHGCVRMKNDDVITLFDEVEVNTLVVIALCAGPNFTTAEGIYGRSS